MAGPKFVLDGAVIPRPRILIADHQANGRTRGFALEHARHDFHRVRFLTLGDEAGRARLTLIQPRLDIGFVQFRPGGTPSRMQPMAGPWLSPHVVMRNRCPKVLSVIGSSCVSRSSSRPSIYRVHRLPSCQPRDNRNRHDAFRRSHLSTGRIASKARPRRLRRW